MRYYKLIDGDSFIGIGSSLDFRRYQIKHNILLCCDELSGEYIECNGSFYRDAWFAPCVTTIIAYSDASVIEISFDEYQLLKEAIDNNEEIIDDQTHDEEYEEEPVIDDKDVTLEALREMKIEEMNYCCRKVIEGGFDIELSDHEVHHFSLTTQDQLNLITLSSMVSSGVDTIPYHADGELCRYYSANDIGAIVEKATAFKTYHTTYVNALKMYIRALNDIETIASIEYGIELQEEYQSDVLKHLLSE